MALPEYIRIRYEPDYYTRYIGGFEDDTKQFAGFVVAVFADPPPIEWEPRKRWYAILHTFDDNGHHIGTSAWFTGTTADGETEVCERAERRLMGMLSELGEYELSDIWIRPFTFELEGRKYGLVDTSDEERGESYTLWPNDFFFTPPWDGTYST